VKTFGYILTCTLAGWWFSSAFAAMTTAPASGPASAPAASRPASRPSTAPAKAVEPLAWRTDYTEAIADARRSNRPILVRAGAVWCGWCKKLDGEIAAPAVQQELRQWMLVYVDVDRMPRDARSLAIGPIPAIRALRPDGRLVASNDGYIKSDDLAEWLRTQYASTAKTPAVARSEDTEKTTAEEVRELVQDLDRRDPAVRERAIRRLILVPKPAAGAVVDALAKGSLAARLAAVDVLQEWGAPLGDIDPWQPDTVDARLDALRKWAAEPEKIATSRPVELTSAGFAMVQRDLDRLMEENVLASEEDAIRERLARYGQALLPYVYKSLERAASDTVRERLTSLRYRLVATDRLVFAWPGGLERLAAIDVETRHRAAEELVERATPAEEPLLLELFSDPDAMVREISLRALRRASGSKVSGALARLLQDPEPNVRAAVLKQLAEDKSEAMLPKIAEYIAVEKDPDLLVHAIRVLRATPCSKSVDCLVSLLGHANWQVRAEAAEALGESMSGGNSVSSKAKKAAGAALLKLLDDSDGFVVSVAVKALPNAAVGDVTEALVRAADKHPELAPDVLISLGENSEQRNKAVPHLRKFCTHSSAGVRAAAITALCKAVPNGAGKELADALKDESSRVRVAATTALLDVIQLQRRQTDDDAAVHIQASESVETSSSLLGLLFGGRRARKVAQTQPTTQSSTQPETQPALTVASTPESAPSQSQPEQLSSDERWLEQFRKGVGRPKWLDEMEPSLQAMLPASAADERVLAAVVLVSLGRDEQALPVIMEVVRQKPDLIGVASRALPWLMWPQRAELFESLIGLRPGAAALTQIAENMAVWPDRRAAQPLWAQFADASVTPEAAGRLLDALRRVYFGNFSYSPNNAPARRRQQAVADASARAQAGPELQRVAALAVLIGVSLKDAGAQAAQVAADPKASDSLRMDAFQIQLLSESRAAGQKLAAEAIAGQDASRQNIAVRFLAEGGESVRTIRGGAIYLYFENSAVDRGFNVQTGQPIKVSAPAGLTPEVLRPLLAGSKDRVAAEVGYLLATLKDASGLEALTRYWREQAREDQTVRRLVYRAITALDDDSQAPLLEEIYRSYPKGDYWLRDYYWTVRSMTGPQVGQLRKKIREEVGMENLR
jgi:HEAT repeat protein